MAAKKRTRVSPSKNLSKKKTIRFKFGERHKEYIRNCRNCTFNILEGAVRSGKTVDNVFAFAHELKTTPDRIHLATGSTMGNAKLNIGDANGYGLEWIFRGQCHWGKYKDLDALIIKGVSTGFRERIVIFSGAGTGTFARIRGNSYGMWIATEINLHSDSMIKEAFNRQLAARRRKIFWDMNPSHPKSPIYTEYIDLYAQKAKEGTLKGGFNYAHFTIFDNVNISQERIDEIISQYDKDSIWYARDILGRRSIAEGLIYPQFASYAVMDDNPLKISLQKAVEMAARHEFLYINVGVDFGGNESAHAFVATAPTYGYGKMVALASETHTGDVDPEELGHLLVAFVMKVITLFGNVRNIYCDSAEQVLIRGCKKAIANAGLGMIRIGNAQKIHINDRIFAMTSLVAQSRFLYTDLCETLEEALTMAVWKPNTVEVKRLDDGTSDIDSLDAFEYSYERDIRQYIKTYRMAGD